MTVCSENFTIFIDLFKVRLDTWDLYLNGKKVKDDETLDGYGEYYTRSRVKMSKPPTLYFSQAKDTDMKMRVYDKARELNEKSPNKAERLKEWLGWDTIDKLYRVEVVLHNTNVREFVERYGERLYSECGEHSNVLNLLGMSDSRPYMITGLLYHTHRQHDFLTTCCCSAASSPKIDKK